MRAFTIILLVSLVTLPPAIAATATSPGLGIGFRSLTLGEAIDAAVDPTEAMVVTSVDTTRCQPTFGAIHPGDLVLRIGRQHFTLTSLRDFMSQFNIGEEVQVHLRRNHHPLIVRCRIVAIEATPIDAVIANIGSTQRRYQAIIASGLLDR